MGNEKYKVYPVEIPLDDDGFYDRPFFAYGIFKKGQLAYSKIEDYVGHVVSGEIPRKMHIRDGLPVVTNEKSEFATKGDKIYFLDDEKEEAYERISNTQPDKVYKWDIVDIDGTAFNILVTEDLVGTFVNVDQDGYYLNCFDGRDDPFFSKVSGFIRKELKNIDYDNEESIFKIQMYYMLLWSAIDRYCVLKYDIQEKQSKYLEALANDEIYQEAFQSINPIQKDPIHSATNATPFYYNRSRPNFIVNYYYTIRCNVVHRGKESGNRINELERALKELLDIFDYIIEKTFSDV